MRPLDGGCTPDRILSSVDLPAPFSPSRPRISPRRTSSETSLERRHAGKVLGDAFDGEQHVAAARRADGFCWLTSAFSLNGHRRGDIAAAWTRRPDRPGDGGRRVRDVLSYLRLADALGLVEIVLADDDRRQQHELLLRARSRPGIGDGDAHRRARLLAGELLDGAGQRAVAHRDDAPRAARRSRRS